MYIWLQKFCHSEMPALRMLSLEPLVVEVPAPEAHVGRGFDDRPGGDVQMSVDVLAVPAAVLAAHKHARAVGAVAHEDAPRRRSHHDLASHAVVDHRRVTLVQDVNFAVLAPVDDKLLTVNGTRGLQELLAGALHVDEVLRVELGLRDEGLGLGFRWSWTGFARGGITTILGLATHRVPRPFVFLRKKATHGSKTYSSVRRALGAPDRPDYKQRQILSSPFAPVWQTPVSFLFFRQWGCAVQTDELVMMTKMHELSRRELQSVLEGSLLFPLRTRLFTRTRKMKNMVSCIGRSTSG